MLPASRRLGAFADYLVINVSSPNTPGLRALQERGRLQELIARVLAARKHTAAQAAAAAEDRARSHRGSARIAAWPWNPDWTD